MKFLHISDLHIGKYLGEMSLLEDQRYFLGQICDLAKEKKCDAVVIAGDIYQRSIPSSDAIVVFEEFLNRLINGLNIPVMIISGNHDSPERIGFGSSLFDQERLCIAGMFERKIHRRVFTDQFGEVEFFLLPYLEPATVRSTLMDSSVNSFDDAYKVVMSLRCNCPDRSKRNVVVAHGYFVKHGSESEVIESESERSIGGTDSVDVTVFRDFDYGAFGHLHAPQKAGSDCMRYSGSMLKYSLSESTQKKSVCVVELREKGDVSFEQVTILPMRDVRLIKGYLDEIIESNRMAGESFDDFIFADLFDEHIFDGMSRLRGVFPNAIGLRFKQSMGEDVFVPKGMEEISHMSNMELFKSFYATVMDDEITQKRESIAQKIMTELEREDIQK